MTEKKIVVIPAQLGLRGIGAALMEQGLVYHPLQFTLPAKLLEADNLKPGEYEFRPQMSVLDIIAQLRAGKTIVHKITIPEGLTNGDIARLLEAEPLLTEPVGTLPPEGALYPATYNFSYGDRRPQFIAQMSKLAQSTLQELWGKRAADLPLQTPQQAAVLASIVEKETGVADERARVAGVFYNRLRLGMRLQSDPTVIYALTLGKTPFKRSLTSADLAFPSPYNTYAVTGLPPAPIANPGRAALQAVLQPEKHDFLYFVADGSGGHAFAKTLEEHNRYVAQWRKLKR
ncbi:MAG: endolytic transglycosylase MltG [Alphaproteobacteria bacterium]|nr:endolytic transglycosylase MltG [Alphaproteobacteria bacterium]